MLVFDFEQKINVNFCDCVVGFVLNVFLVNIEEKFVCVGVGVIEGIFCVFFGWYVNDDGCCMFVFDGGGWMQINLSLCWWVVELFVEFG